MRAGGPRKKLKAAARLVATGRLDDAAWSTSDLDRVLGDLEAFGAPPEAIEKVRKQYAAEARDLVLPIHPANGTAVRLFLALQTQWRTQSLSTSSKAIWIRTGLDYGVIADTARLVGLEMRSEDFARLQILETEALIAWAEERSR